MDSTGKFVASAVYEDYLQIGSDFVSLGLIALPEVSSPTGFVEADAGGISFYHLAANCAGPRLVLSYDSFIGPLLVLNNIGYYPTGPLIAQTVQSVENFLSGEDVSQPSTHCSSSALPISSLAVYGALKTINMSSLGFVPPFYFALE